MQLRRFMRIIRACTCIIFACLVIRAAAHKARSWHNTKFMAVDPCASFAAGAAGDRDVRDVCGGAKMLVAEDAARFVYADQPSCTVVDIDGPQKDWLCVVTVSEEDEGGSSQYVASLSSSDAGRTFSRPRRVSEDTPSSWAVPIRLASGMVAIFYTHNDAHPEIDPDTGNARTRVDMTGPLWLRTTNDFGKSWGERILVKQRVTDCDRSNVYGGNTIVGWAVSPPILLRDGGLLMQYSKICGGKSWVQRGLAKPNGFMWQSEVWFVRAHAALELTPDRWVWDTLPKGERGVRARPTGFGVGWVNEEGAVVELSNGVLISYFRTAEGWVGERRSEDGGESWLEDSDGFATLAPASGLGEGRRMKHPRATMEVKPSFQNT
jgi:hypothetical protein